MEESSDDDHQTLSQTLHVQTPLIHSPKLSVKLDCNIYFKIENVQPSGSVKMRGIGNFCYKAVESRGRDIHLVCGSGTNTVLAVAYCARQLNVSAITVMPKDTPSSICDSVRLEGAHLILYGEDWAAADEHARKLVKRNGVYVPSSDHADIWQGHASIIHELKTQLQDNPPAAIICPVGGGGLLNGVITGLQSVGWKSVPVIAVETHGSNAFQASVVAGKLVTLPKISTIASGLASSTVSSKSLELSLVHPVVPFAVSDAMAADAVRLFAEDAKMIVEAASGAALSLCYTQLIRDILPSLGQDCEVIVLVTGGSDISLTQLDEYRKKYYRPPVIVKSGGEVFLKMDDKLTHIQSIDSTEPLGISSDNLTKLNQSNKQKTKESNKQQKLQQQQLQLQQKQELLQQQEQQLQQQQLQQQQQQQHQQLQPQQPQQIQKLQLQQAQPQLLPQLQSQIQSQLQPLQQLQQLQQLQSHLQSHLQSQEQNAIVDTPMEETFQSSTQEEDPSSIKPLTPANTQ